MRERVHSLSTSSVVASSALDEQQKNPLSFAYTHFSPSLFLLHSSFSLSPHTNRVQINNNNCVCVHRLCECVRINHICTKSSDSNPIDNQESNHLIKVSRKNEDTTLATLSLSLLFLEGRERLE